MRRVGVAAPYAGLCKMANAYAAFVRKTPPAANVCFTYYDYMERAMPDCIFCKIAGGEIPSPRVYENDDVFVIDDINPVSKVHALIITKAHFDNILSLGAENAGILLSIQQAVRETAKIKGVAESGFRLISNCGKDGGQSVPHLHFHLIGGKKLSLKII